MMRRAGRTPWTGAVCAAATDDASAMLIAIRVRVRMGLSSGANSDGARLVQAPGRRAGDSGQDFPLAHANEASQHQGSERSRIMSRAAVTKRIQTVIIGAGQAGLSVGYYLARQKL